MSKAMAKVLAWGAVVLGGLLATAIVALLNTWADVREIKKTMEDVKAERIKSLEKDVEYLKDRCSHKPLWEAIGRKEDKRGA